MAKPTVYREAVVEEILSQLALGKSLASICKDRRMPTYRSVISWLVRDFRGFADRYWAARRAQCIHLSEEIITIADEAVGADMAGANVAKLRCDARKWTLARMDGARWGDAIAHQHQVSGEARIVVSLPAKGSSPPMLIEGRAETAAIEAPAILLAPDGEAEGQRHGIKQLRHIQCCCGLCGNVAVTKQGRLTRAGTLLQRSF